MSRPTQMARPPALADRNVLQAGRHGIEQYAAPPRAPLQTAVDIVLEKKVGCLPVVDGGSLVGLLTETDCLQRLRALLDAGETRQALPALPPL
jgi:hypothetical protein